MFALVMVAFVLWALCGVPAALIAHRKGRNVVMWAVLGSVFGVIGLAAIASAPYYTQGGPWHPGSSTTLHFGSFSGFGLSGDHGGNDFGFGDFGGSSDFGGGGDGGGGGGGGGD
ncbi:hypothetical protein PDG61_13530 [Mycolicibacterium sp. BiH015]|uniref:hypothetical protein n=1 Tax=Mycolicibacterium sp. BiH015 TaxID=3018808 RepID=UPI0022E118D0|nr:hypothetical protein [Mycolicibacterium sp. BiH015]MDA2891940.1 hypothetical protein [Mycolicibacterium sp. BiH015]